MNSSPYSMYMGVVNDTWPSGPPVGEECPGIFVSIQFCAPEPSNNESGSCQEGPNEMWPGTCDAISDVSLMVTSAQIANRGWRSHLHFLSFHVFTWRVDTTFSELGCKKKRKEKEKARVRGKVWILQNIQLKWMHKINQWLCLID